MIIKLTKSETEKLIIQWEEKAWENFQKIMEPWQKSFQEKGMEITLLHYWWINGEIRNERPPFDLGYTFICQFLVKKDGKVFKYKEDEETIMTGSYYFVEIEPRFWFSGIWKHWKKFREKGLWVVLKGEEEFNARYMKEYIEDYLEYIENGEYII